MKGGNSRLISEAKKAAVGKLTHLIANRQMSHLPSQQSKYLMRTAFGASSLASQSLINNNFFDNVKQLKSGTEAPKLSLKEQHLQNFWGRWLRDGNGDKPEKQQAAHNDGETSTDYEHDDDAFGVRRPSRRLDD